MNLYFPAMICSPRSRGAAAAHRQPDQPVLRQSVPRRLGSFRHRGVTRALSALRRRFRFVRRRSCGAWRNGVIASRRGWPAVAFVASRARLSFWRRCRRNIPRQRPGAAAGGACRRQRAPFPQPAARPARRLAHRRASMQTADRARVCRRGSRMRHMPKRGACAKRSSGRLVRSGLP